MITNCQTRQFQVFDRVRFPLAVLVIFIHMVPITESVFTLKAPLLSWHGIYNLLGIIISNGIARAAVPTFFIISGYLFFVNFRDWNWEIYRRKISSRIKSLCVPYLFWNILPWFLFLLCAIGGVLFHKKPWSSVYEYISEHGLRFLWNGNEGGPINLPLWFLRDLICVTILTPLIYYFIKYLKVWSILFLIIAYICRVGLPCPGFGITAIFFFSLGAFFAIHGIDILNMLRKSIFITIPTAIVSFSVIICSVFVDDIFISLASVAFTLSIVPLLYLNTTPPPKHLLAYNKSLASSCLFIYAAHCCPLPFIGSILYIVRITIDHIIPGESYIENTLVLLTAPIFTAYILVLTYSLIVRIIPKSSLFLSGNR